jgi:hypothetical protein
MASGFRCRREALPAAEPLTRSQPHHAGLRAAEQLTAAGGDGGFSAAMEADFAGERAIRRRLGIAVKAGLVLLAQPNASSIRILIRRLMAGPECRVVRPWMAGRRPLAFCASCAGRLTSRSPAVRCGQPLGRARGACRKRTGDQAAPVLHQRMAHEAGLRLLAWPLAVELRIGGGGSMGVVAALLATDVLPAMAHPRQAAGPIRAWLMVKRR